MAAKKKGDDGPVTSQKLTTATDTDGYPYDEFEKTSAREWKTRKRTAELREISRAEEKDDGDKKKKKKKKPEPLYTPAEAAKKAKEEIDGATPEQQSAYLREWKQAVIDRLKSSGYGGEAKTLTGSPGKSWLDQEAGADDDLLRKVYDGKDYNAYRQPLMKALGRGLVTDPDWQPETTASYIDKTGKKKYPNPYKEPYWVSSGDNEKSGFPMGTFAKITGPNGNSMWARALDTNGKKGVHPGGAFGSHQLEASPALFNGLGYQASGTSNPEGKFGINILPGSAGDASTPLGELSNDEVQEAGSLLEGGYVKSIRNREDLERARKAKEEKDKENGNQPTPPPQKGAGVILEKGFTGVYQGEKRFAVGYADQTCKHSGGGFVNEGSDCVYVGKFPLARITDATSDDLNVKTGGVNTWVGGGTTSTKLA